jgi:hypothetical protein
MEYIIKLFGSDKATIIQLRPGKDLFVLNTALLSVGNEDNKKSLNLFCLKTV